MNLAEQFPGRTVSWSVGDAAKGTALVFGGSLFLVLAIAPFIRNLNGLAEPVALLLSLVLEGVLLLAVWRFGPWKYGLSWDALGLQPTLNNGAPMAVLALLGIVGFNVFYSAVITFLDVDALRPPALPPEMAEGLLLPIVGFFLVVLVAPVAEEVFYRGFLLPVFADRWGFLAGSGFVSLLFAVSHVVPGLLAPAFVSGMLLAWLYRRTGALWTCCLAHGAQNAMAFALFVVAP